MIMTEEEMDEQLECLQALHENINDMLKTESDVEKLEYELQRAQSEIRDLKELIIKMLFDKYGY